MSTSRSTTGRTPRGAALLAASTLVFAGVATLLTPPTIARATPAPTPPATVGGWVGQVEPSSTSVSGVFDLSDAADLPLMGLSWLVDH